MQLPFYSSLDEVKNAAKGCQACGRSKQRTQVVSGAGSPEADLMLVGEYPSQSDDLSGVPFSGPAGEYLDQLLAAAGTNRDELYITNIVRCYATQSGAATGRIKGATKRERVACSVWMDLETHFVNPRFILAIGAAAGGALIDENFQLTEEHGIWRERPDGRWVSATMQPAYILRIRPHDPERADELHEIVSNEIRAAVERSRSTPPG